VYREGEVLDVEEESSAHITLVARLPLATLGGCAAGTASWWRSA
jgi:hypothetical protein